MELVYALHETKSLNNGTVSLKNLFAVFGETFDVEVKHFSRTFTDIKNRTKGDRTIFADKLKNALLQKFNETEEIAEKRR